MLRTASPSNRSALRAGWRVPVAGFAVSAVLSLVVPAAADDSVRDARRSREEARAAQAQAATQINALSAQDDQIAHALTVLEQTVSAQRSVVEDATRALSAAEIAAAERQRALTETELSIERARDQIAQFAVASYVGRTFDDSVTVVLESSDAAHAVRRAALLEVVHGSERDAVDELRDLEARRTAELALAHQSVVDADTRRAELALALDELQGQVDAQHDLRTALQTRIAAWEHEQDQLAAEEAALTQLISEKQTAALGSALSAEARQGFSMPTAGVVGSRFGPRMHPIYRRTRLHAGVDIGGRTGDRVNAAKAGTVLFAGVRGGYGNVVILEHVGGVTTVYAHLSAIDARHGATVSTGQRIGRIGSTGLSTGPHLHFEVRVNGVPKDPELFLP